MDLDKAIKERHSVRTFKETKKSSWKDVVKAIDAANYAPTAGNVPSLKFVVINEPAKIKQIAQACQQNFVSKCNFVVVACSDNTQIKRSFGERAEKFSKQQAGAAIQNFLLEITNLGLGSCWVGDFVDEQIRETLLIPDGIEVEAVLPVGYELNKNPKKRKLPDLDNVVWFNKWKNKYMITPFRPGD